MSKLLKPTILSISLVTTMASAAVSPALAKISQAFPNASPTVIKSVLTLPAMAIIPVSLMSGWLASRFSNRHILLLGLIIFFAGGIAGAFASNITELLATRCILGVGIGLVMPLSSSIIADFYQGKERASMMGLSGSLTNLGGMFFLAVAGWLACYSWRYSFGVYGLALVSLIMVMLWLPERSQPMRKTTPKIQISRGVFISAVLAVLLMIAFFAILTNLALFIEHEKKMYTTETPMFQNKEELQSCLKTGTISEVTIQSFSANGIKLSNGASIAALTPGKEWRIQDRNKKYIVRKEKDHLTISTEQLGRPALAGYALSVMTLCGVISGLFLNALMSFLGPFCVPAALAFMAAGFGLLSQAVSLSMVFMAVPFIGFSIGVLIPSLMLRVSSVATEHSRPLAMAIVGASIFLGQFLSPIVLKIVVSLAGHDTYRFRFGFIASCLVLAAFSGFILARRPAKAVNG